HTATSGATARIFSDCADGNDTRGSTPPTPTNPTSARTKHTSPPAYPAPHAHPDTRPRYGAGARFGNIALLKTSAISKLVLASTTSARTRKTRPGPAPGAPIYSSAVVPAQISVMVRTHGLRAPYWSATAPRNGLRIAI